MFLSKIILSFINLCIFLGDLVLAFFQKIGQIFTRSILNLKKGLVAGWGLLKSFKRRSKQKSKSYWFSLNYYLFFYRVKYFAFGFLIALVFFTAQQTVEFINHLPSLSLLENNQINNSTHILDRSGKLLYEIYREENRTPVKLADLPAYIRYATISIEDKDFYKHKGVSLIGGVLRAAKETLFRKKLQGGSTITQQLVKSALLTPERTIERKIKEIILAVLVERKYSKDQILEMYLNQVPYGGTAWGIEEASRLYFGKSAKQLSLPQAALLAGLPQAPSIYSPFTNPKLAMTRQQEVLYRMYQEKYLSKAEYDKYKQVKLTFKKPASSILAPHFVFYVKETLEQEYGLKTVTTGGLKVYTTLDYNIQKEAEKILKEELDKVKDLQVGNGAILVTRPSTGEILSMVGSKDFFDGSSGAYNVTTALRQPGSSIKPINYAVGIERKLVTPATVFLDIPTCFAVSGQKGYCPVNYDGNFHGPVQLRFALANSFNIPAVKMLALNKVPDFVASASAWGIKSFSDPSRYGLSLTLGGGEVRMTDFAKAYSAFPNQGIVKDLVSILKVEDRNGQVLYQYKDANYVKDVRKALDYPNYLLINGKRVISKATAYLISHILLDDGARSQAFGTGSLLNVPGHKAVSVKTGTTDDLRDNWTVGYTPNFLTMVWVGNNDNSKMNPYLVSGVTGAAPIWNRVMQTLLKSQEDLWPKKPDSVVWQEVCTVSGLKPNIGGDGAKSCPTRSEYFIVGTEPKNTESLNKKVIIDKSNNKLAKPGQTDNIEEQDKQVVSDSFSTYCLDCSNEKGDYNTVTIQ